MPELESARAEARESISEGVAGGRDWGQSLTGKAGREVEERRKPYVGVPGRFGEMLDQAALFVAAPILTLGGGFAGLAAGSLSTGGIESVAAAGGCAGVVAGIVASSVLFEKAVDNARARQIHEGRRDTGTFLMQDTFGRLNVETLHADGTWTLDRKNVDGRDYRCDPSTGQVVAYPDEVGEERAVSRAIDESSGTMNLSLPGGKGPKPA